MRTIQFCALVLVLSTGVYSQQCIDCVNFDRCPNALSLALYQRTPETLQLFREAGCGYDRSSGKMPKAMVCCSMFSVTNKRGEIKDPKLSEDQRIANHKSLALLPEDCGNIKGDRIVGGEIADMYEFPWMALISYETPDGKKFKCGGTIINKRYILTAAHCVKNKIIADVRVGEYDLDTEIDCHKGVYEKHYKDIPVENKIVHEKYQGFPVVINDIALLRVSEDIDFNHRNVHRICLPTKSEHRHQSLTSVKVTVTGWGITENHTESAVLRKVDIPIYTAQECSDLYNRFAKPGEPDATEAQLCAGSQNKDSCKGDSGGPMIHEELFGNVYKYVQYGVVSHGPRHCGSDFPGVYTDVRKYMGRILDNISP